jgi:hypothetical protein
MADDERDADTDESPAVGAPATSSPEGEQSPADAQRSAEGRPADPQATAVRNTVPDSGDKPEGTGPGGAVRGGYGLGATGAEGRSDVRGPSDTGGGRGGQSPMDAQRRADAAEDAFAERPHLYVAGAFLGGLVLAQILKRLGGDDD